MLRYVLVLMTATLACVQAQKIDQEEIPSCQGVFDFYFVLDRCVASSCRSYEIRKCRSMLNFHSSGSVDENFHSEVVPFVRNVSSYFVR